MTVFINLSPKKREFWVYLHYTGMGHSSSSFCEAPPVPAGIRTHDLPFRWPWTYQEATGDSVKQQVLENYPRRVEVPNPQQYQSWIWLFLAKNFFSFWAISSIQRLCCNNILALFFGFWLILAANCCIGSIDLKFSEYTVKVHNSTLDPHSLYAPVTFTCWRQSIKLYYEFVAHWFRHPFP